MSETASEALVSAIVSGALAPGSKLNIRAVSEDLGVGATPLREALSGLAGRGLVTFSGQRGFRVAPASQQDLRDIVTTRTIIEVGALRLAIAQGDTDWEIGILSATHRLRSFYHDLPEAFEEQIEQFEVLNRGFHFALIAACNSPRLLSFYGDLFDQTRRYREMSLHDQPRLLTSSLETHLDLADLCLARDTDAACAAIEKHNMIVAGQDY